MPAPDPFVEHIIDLLTSLGPVRPKRLFGGWGLYLDGVIFAIVHSDTLFLKVDAENRSDFEAAGKEPLVYEGRTGLVALPYWEAPWELLDDGEELCRWVRRAHEAGRRAQADTQPKRRHSGPRHDRRGSGHRGRGAR